MGTAGQNPFDPERLATFGRLRDRVRDLLSRFGRFHHLPADIHGDFSVNGDYAGCPEVVVFIHKLNLLRPPVVYAMQSLIKEFPGWQITVTIAVRGHYEDWPNMGLYIRPHEIVDGLQRQYLPEELRDIAYDGARKGTADD